MLTAQRNNSDLQQVQKDQRSIATDVEKWKAVVGRDEAKDGLFVFAVRSTGIYCKPSCPARHPSLEQVIFFSQPDAAKIGLPSVQTLPATRGKGFRQSP